MKKRLLSLLLAVVLCIGLLPVGALAASEPAYYDTVKEDGTINRGGGYMTADLYTETSTDSVTWGEVSYVIKNDVTINGDLTIDARSSFARVLLCNGAKLTINGALKFAQGTRPLYVYGETVKESGNVGTLVINHTGSGAAIQSESTTDSILSIHGGTLEISSTSGDLVKNVMLEVQNSYLGTSSCTVMKATRTDVSGSSEELKYGDWAGLVPAKIDLKGSKLVIEYCGHRTDDATYSHIEGTDTHTETCTVCGFAQTVPCDLYAVSVTDTTHTMGCYYCDNRHSEKQHTRNEENTQYVVTADGKGHSNSVCSVCTYSFGKPEAHDYGANGSCKYCYFTPFMSDSEGNLYGEDSYQAAFEKAADSNGAVTLTLVSEVTGEGANIWTKSIEFNYPGKSVTLDMGGITLSSTGEAALLVSGGELIIQNAATLEGASASGELSSTPAIKVTDGALTFNGTVNATGGAKNSSAAPAILVEGGTVTFNQTVIATAAVNEEANAAIAPAIKVTGSGKAIFNGTVKATGGLNGTTGNLRQCQPAILADQNGKLEFNGDLNLNGGLTITGNAKLTKGLTRGTFQVKYLKADGETKEAITEGKSVSVEGSTVYKNGIYGNVNKLLADKHVFVKIRPEGENDEYLTASYQYLAWDVTIKYHEHDFKADKGYECVCGVSCDHSAGYENGKCKTCGKPCSHLRLGTGDRYCLDCGQKMLVQNTKGDRDDRPNFKYAYFTNLNDAMAAATEDGWTVKLLDNIDDIGRGIDIYEKNSGTQTITLDLNGKNITGSNPIWIGKPNNNIISTTTLKIVGSGNISLGNSALIVSEKSTLDLEDWTRGTIDIVSVSCNGNTGDEGSLIVGENDIYIGKLLYQSWSLSTIKKAKLSGGTYGSINMTLTDYLSPGILFGALLVPGYAFQYADGSGSFVNYATKATYDAGGVIYNVKVVKCTTHVDAKRVAADGNITDGADNLCDYCNANLTVATVATLTVGGATYYYTDLPSALKAASDKGGTVQLQKDVTGVQETLRIDKEASPDITLDLNGHTISSDSSINGTLFSVSTFGTVTIDDSSSNKTGRIECTDPGEYAVYVSGGTLTIKAGTYKATDIAGVGSLPGQPAYALGVGMTGELIINGGTSESQMYVSGGNLTINGGTFKEAVTIAVSGTEIKGGTFNGAFTMSAQPDVFSGGMFKEQASFSNVSNILTGGTFEKGLSTTSSWTGLASLLKRNYKYKTTGGWHYLDAEYNVADSVTVAEVPIHSPVSLIAYPGSKEYGKSQDITLSASCGGSAEDLYVGWFLVHEDGTQDLVSNGGKGLTKVENKSATYTLPAGLAIGTYKYRVAFYDKDIPEDGNTPSDAYIETAEITIEITKIDIANVPEDQIELELAYGGNAPYDINGATNADGVHATTMALSPVKPFKVNGTVLNENDYTLEGNVQYGVGEYTLKINVDTAIYTGSIERTWHVIPRKLGPPQFLQGNYIKTYDGGTALPQEITYFNGSFEEAGKDPSLLPTELEESDYTLTNEAFENATVGKDKRISLTIQLTNKNYEFNTSYIKGLAMDGVTVTADAITYTNCILHRSAYFDITPATMPNFDKEVTLHIVNNLAHTYTVELPTLPELQSPKTYGDITHTVASQSLEHGYATLGQPTVKQVDGKYQLCLTVPAVKYDQETSIGTILVKVTTTNYNDVVLTVNLNAVNKFQPAVAVQAEPKTVTYGTTLANITPVFEAIYDGQPVGGTVMWDLSADTMPGTDTKYLAWMFTPSDPDKYFGATGNASITVTPATLTGAPKYTAITASGKKLSDAGLAANESWPVGTLQWVDKDGKALDAAATEVKANTAYQWKFTPDSKNYDPIEGSITLYYVSTGGGSTTYPVSTPSKTENGSVSVSPKNASRGDTVTITVKPNDGYVLDDLAVTDKNGNDLKLTDKGNGKYTFTMPAGKVEVKASFAEEAETSPFADVATNAYYYEAVKWAAEQGITGGIGNNLFGPNQPCTRAQIVTFLWRAAGSPEPKDMSSFADVSTDSYYAKAVAWAVENGITSGTGDGKFSPDATCTRAQAVMFLARALNAKATSAAEFSDVPTDSYFAEAVAWAASNGVTAGIGGGLFGPNNDCTRAQIVTFLFRAYNK